MAGKDRIFRVKRYGTAGKLMYSLAAVGLRLSRVPVIGKFFDIVASRHRLKVVTVPVEAKFSRNPAVLHIDAAKALVEASSYIVRTDCMCRESQQCTEYPIDIGCLFLGEGARKMGRHNKVRPVTREEALAHLERAREAGLITNVIWSSLELAAMGADPAHTVELCSCCPCCCLAFKTRNASVAFLDGIAGFGVSRITSVDDCTRCTNCVGVCPFKAIRLDDIVEGPVIDERRCKGCGRCEVVCRPGVIKIVPFEPAKSATPLPGTMYLEEFLQKVR
ncbi:4Fe-4S binding protein [Methanocella arvoryzae]|uniref:2(4Fe-4S) ferredoxin-domain protein n=1 Tax=Methanocella arvoryzae (strain DSM 22066 / NBRC 105507 / MRE50) TaxID=351160 RepID=Q0W393_METAR|nr:4Fe-4S binding protein [Methanocella arvoryzae]CAJ37150.1 2(4Fe-4S) ferredoxin-domain protein [Methanocella arvoryzae MRE50]